MRVEIEGLDQLEQKLREASGELGYVVLADRADRSKEDVLERLDLVTEEGHSLLYAGPDPVTRAMTWVREVIENNAVGEAEGRYRVYAWAPRGSRRLFTFTLLTRDVRCEAEEREDTESRVERRGLDRLGDAYDRYVNMVLDGTGRLKDITVAALGAFDTVSKRQLDHLSHEVAAGRQQVNELVSAVTHARLSEANARAEIVSAAAQQQNEDQGREMRTMLAREALGQVASLTQALMMQKGGLDPETTEVLNALRDSPDMQAVLRNPTLRAQLCERENLNYLAFLIQQAANHAQEASSGGGEQAGTGQSATPSGEDKA